MVSRPSQKILPAKRPRTSRDLRAILISREPLYARAHAVVDTAGIKVEAAAKRLTNVIETNVVREKQITKRDRRETRASSA